MSLHDAARAKDRIANASIVTDAYTRGESTVEPILDPCPFDTASKDFADWCLKNATPDREQPVILHRDSMFVRKEDHGHPRS